MPDGSHWVGTWTTAPAPAETGAFTNQTLRMTMRASLGGNQVRVRISNAYGQRPLALGSVHIALRDTGPAPGVSRRRGWQRVHLLPPGRCDDTAAGRAGSDGSAARRRLGSRGGCAAIGPQSGQRIGGRSPAMASGAAAANTAVGRADATGRCARSEPPGPSDSSGQAGCGAWRRAG